MPAELSALPGLGSSAPSSSIYPFPHPDRTYPTNNPGVNPPNQGLNLGLDLGFSLFSEPNGPMWPDANVWSANVKVE